jgi:hypothetical protein
MAYLEIDLLGKSFLMTMVKALEMWLTTEIKFWLTKLLVAIWSNLVHCGPIWSNWSNLVIFGPSWDKVSEKESVCGRGKHFKREKERGKMWKSGKTEK